MFGFILFVQEVSDEAEVTTGFKCKPSWKVVELEKQERLSPSPRPATAVLRAGRSANKIDTAPTHVTSHPDGERDGENKWRRVPDGAVTGESTGCSVREGWGQSILDRGTASAKALWPL